MHMRPGVKLLFLSMASWGELSWAWHGAAAQSCLGTMSATRASRLWLPRPRPLPPAAAAASSGRTPAGGADAGAGAAPLLDGPGRYELLAIISHMGQNTACGHYVCHVK